MSTNDDLTTAAAALGRKGGVARTEAKAAAARENGRKGGRPPKKRIVEHCNHFALVEGGTVIGSTTWIEGLNGPVFVAGGRERARAAIEQLAKIGYMPDFA